MTPIDEIKARLDILDIVSETIQLRHTGKNYTGFCPFHPNTRTPAFVIFPETGTWRCFGQCNEGGDIFKFVMKRDRVDFSEALRSLAERAGVQLKPPSPEEEISAEEHQGLRELLEEAVTYYRHQLLNTPAGQETLEYIRTKRGLKDDTIESFGLGYAPDAWDAAFSHFTSRGYRIEQLLSSGMISERDSGGYYDRFRHRLMFPIRDARGRMAGFGARILNPEDIPKFINSPQTAIFDKSNLLYGLDKARKEIQALDQAVLVEGYLDVIALHQAGFTNAVSPMGTALTEHQLFLLKRYTRRIILALDADAAGEKATLRGLRAARQTMDREGDPVFDARGMLRNEARLKADIRVITLPAGEDPDDVATRNPEEWQEMVDKARPIVIHVMEALASGRNLDDPKIKTEIANQVLPLIEDIPSSIERDTYRQRLARFLRVSERSLDEFLPGRTFRRRGTDQVAQVKIQSKTLQSASVSAYALEAHCLGILLRKPDLLYQVDRRLQEAGLERLSPQDFQHADHQSILRLFQESVNQDLAEPLNFVLNSLSLPLMELADELLARTSEFDPNDDRVVDDLIRGLLELRKRNLYQEMEYLQFLMDDSQDDGDSKPNNYERSIKIHAETRRRLDIAIGQYTGRTLPVR